MIEHVHSTLHLLLTNAIYHSKNNLTLGQIISKKYKKPLAKIILD